REVSADLGAFTSIAAVGRLLVDWPRVLDREPVREQRALRARAPPTGGPARDRGRHDPEPTVPLARRPGMEGDPVETVQLGGSRALSRPTLDQHTPSGLCGVVST